MDRVPTGIEGLDRLLHGGFPAGSTTLLVGPTGTGKTMLCSQFVKAGLANGETAVAILSSLPTEHFAGLAGATAAELSKLRVVDLYSARVQGETGRNAVPKSDINELNLAVRKALGQPPTPARVVMDSISDLLLYQPPESIFKFVQLLTAQIRLNGAAGLIVLEDGMHTAEQRNTLEYMLDNVIEMRLDEGKRSMRIKKMSSTQHPLNWVEYTIDNGIQMRVSPVFK